MPLIKEEDMYPPLRDFLIARGYTVRSEVRGCDVVAEKDGEVIVLEMKRHLSVSLLAQAAARQKIVQSVYVVVPHPGKRVKGKEWKAALHLLRRLELGLVLVCTQGGVSGDRDDSVEIAQHPIRFERKTRGQERAALIREVHGRSDDYNRGGSTGRKLVTAYRENAVMIACLLSALGPSTPARLRDAGTGPKTLSILSSNFYGWFERVARATYALTPRGLEEASRLDGLWKKYSLMAEGLASSSVT